MNSEQDAWRYLKNLLVLGGTRQGKSVLLNQLHATHPWISFFFAPDPEPWFKGATIRDPAHLSDGLRAGHRKFVIPVGLWGDVEGRFARWAVAILELGDRLGGWRCNMAIDEAQEVHNDLLVKAAKRGLKRGFRLNISTQDPSHSQVPPAAITQCDYIAWVGPAGGQEISWLQGAKVLDRDPGDFLRDVPNHHVTVVDKRGDVRWHGYADNEKYGDGT